MQKATSKPSLDTVTSKHTTNKEGILDSLTRTQQCLLLSLCLFGFFGIHNILQEGIMQIPGFTHGIMLGYFEVLALTVCSFMERRYIQKEFHRVISIKSYIPVAACLMASSSMSNMSLNYINYPTKVVVRSCKLIPAMILGTIINRRVFHSVEYIAAIAISIGVVMFAAADWKLSPNFEPIGLVLISLSVVADAISPNLQERLFRLGSSRLEVTMYTNVLTFVAMTTTTLLSGDLISVTRVIANNRKLQYCLMLYTVVSYLAVSTYMILVKRFGGITAVLIATARKAMSLVLSFLLFPKDFSWWYLVGATLILGGMVMSSLSEPNKLKHTSHKEISHSPMKNPKKLKQTSHKDISHSPMKNSKKLKQTRHKDISHSPMKNSFELHSMKK